MIIETAMQLCDIVKHTLNDNLYVKPIDNEDELFLMAKENGLSGLIYPTLKNSTTSTKLLSALKKEHYVYISQSALQEQAIRDIKNILDKIEVRHIFLKGSTLRYLYPEPYMRSMGDIDILVDSNNMERIHTIFENHKYENKENSPAHDRFKHVNGTYIEVHPQLVKKIDGLNIELFEDSWVNSELDEGFTYRLKPEYEMTYFMYHAAKHFKSSGVGLRSLLDIGLYSQFYEKDISKELLLRMVENTNLKTFSLKLLKLQYYYFCIPGLNELYFDIELSEELIDFMTKYIVISGVHGTGDKFNNTIPKLAKQNSKHPKLKFFFKALFPPLETMSGLYSFVNNKWYLYPFAWFIRIFKLLTFRRKTSFTTLHQMKISKTHINKTTVMLKELGL